MMSSALIVAGGSASLELSNTWPGRLVLEYQISRISCAVVLPPSGRRLLQNKRLCRRLVETV